MEWWGLLTNEMAAPSFSAHVRWCEHVKPAAGLKGKDCGIPHLAKNERDVGHPPLVAGLEP
jgi:hypothetical protein